jgi:hypothetical protein
MRKMNEICDELDYEDIFGFNVDYDEATPFNYEFFEGLNGGSVDIEIGQFGSIHNNCANLRKSGYSSEGRFWKKHKIFSFWQYPTKEEWKIFIEEFEKRTGLNVWNNDWRIEIPLIPIQDMMHYKRGDMDNARKMAEYYGVDYKYINDFRNSLLIPIEIYKGTEFTPPLNYKEIHMMNVAQKEKLRKQGKLSVPPNFGSRAKKDSEKGAWTFAKKFEDFKLNENPDNPINTDLYSYDWDARSFRFNFKDEELIFSELYNKGGPHRTGIAPKSAVYSKYEDDSNFKTVPDKYTIHNNGRLWKERKVICFWIYPNPDKLFNVILPELERLSKEVKDVKLKEPLKFDNTWLIEVIYKDGEVPYDNNMIYNSSIKDREIIPLFDYKGSKNPTEEEYLNHLNKGNTKVPPNFGSRAKKDSEKGAWTFAKKFEDFKLNESPDSVKWEDHRFNWNDSGTQCKPFAFKVIEESNIDDNGKMIDEKKSDFYDCWVGDWGEGHSSSSPFYKRFMYKSPYGDHEEHGSKVELMSQSSKGRLWYLNDLNKDYPNVFTVWIFYEQKKTFLKMIEILEEKIGHSLRDWQVDLGNNEFILMSEFLKTDEEIETDFSKDLELHMMNPVEKEKLRKQGKLSVPPNFGSRAKKDSEKGAWTFAKKFEDFKLNEAADYITWDGKGYDYFDCQEAKPFGFRLKDDKIKETWIGEPFEYHEEHCPFKADQLTRGRLWFLSDVDDDYPNIISIWQINMLDIDELTDVVDNLEEKLGYSLKDWYLDIGKELGNPNQKIVKLYEYIDKGEKTDADFSKEEELHLMSPIEKEKLKKQGKISIPKNFGSYAKKDSERGAWTFAKKFEDFKLNESPEDIVKLGLNQWDDETRPFGFDEYGDSIIGDYGDSHYSEWDAVMIDEMTYNYPGRFWETSKIISFWVYPPKEKFKEMINELGINADIKFWDNGWEIEVIIEDDKIYDKKDGDLYNITPKERIMETKIIPIEEYIGSDDVPKEEYLNHLNKGNAKVPPNFGSRAKKDSERGAWTFAKKFEDFKNI